MTGNFWVCRNRTRSSADDDRFDRNARETRTTTAPREGADWSRLKLWETPSCPLDSFVERPDSLIEPAEEAVGAVHVQPAAELPREVGHGTARVPAPVLTVPTLATNATGTTPADRSPSSVTTW